jgi:hypothetical protein
LPLAVSTAQSQLTVLQMHHYIPERHREQREREREESRKRENAYEWDQSANKQTTHKIQKANSERDSLKIHSKTVKRAHRDPIGTSQPVGSVFCSKFLLEIGVLLF